MSSTLPGPDGKLRCSWCTVTPEYLAYHDNEWGYPVNDDIRLFEKLCLESFQCGLSWRTILAKRENFRKAFAGFDVKKMAKFTETHVEKLLLNEGIVRHRGKIEAVINNAQRAQEMIRQEGSLAAYFWRFEADATDEPELHATTSKEAIALSKDLKKRGWKFVGPTTVYAFMQAMGLVNDHAPECEYRKKIARARARFKRPT
jgi:DNA-3-methyladenine glycosylase I